MFNRSTPLNVTVNLTHPEIINKSALNHPGTLDAIPISMKTTIQIAAYSITELSSFSPIGDWVLVSEDKAEVLAVFYNASLRTLNSTLSVHQGAGNDACTLVLESNAA